MDTETCLKLVGVHVQATEGTASRMNLGLSRCLRRRQYLTHGAGKVSAQEFVQEGAGVSADLDPSRFWIPYDVTHCLGMRRSLKCRKVTYKMCVAHPWKWLRFLE